ncbi:DNA mismatch repair protein MutS [Brotonthovivens ammoniilytica]|uniref:DNA mismatch repair protein MutS n=1 Tax=Brotonthovivens ammoniilytica TaxID=2981725 RepID=A0ABT2TH37_9FIRM|nr:DNA mismatch repair protein MutS [Brotonthovivens ammoniilytica]MCU6761216.1 DNA mismatch repair protein MutS [Brotonthovivens ammoniilytica]
MAEYTPMMQKYLETKEEYKDCILFYRLGDFYEMFFEDALTASRELEITLTGKNCGTKERAPMCGVPFHSVEGYLNKLVSKGYKVAICEQVEDPKTAKGLVKREVVRIVTPGTNLDTNALDETKNNYIMCIVYTENKYGISTADVTTGDYYVTEVDTERKLLDEISKFTPSEIICNESFYMSSVDLEDLRHRLGITVYSLESWYFGDDTAIDTLKSHFKVASLSGLGLKEYDCGVIAAGALLKYLYETQKTFLEHMSRIQAYSTSKFMIIDSSTRRNLELVETMREKQKRGSLLWVLDKTKTAMGARMLRTMLEQPLIEKSEIEARLDALEELNKNMITREELREYLNPIYDLERLIGKVVYQTANPRDLTAFKNSLKMLPPVKVLMKDFSCSLLSKLSEQLDTLKDLCSLIEQSIDDDPPISVRDGGMIKNGYDDEIDRLRNAKTEGKSWLAKLEEDEREKTGIKNLKIKYNKVFGYYLEVTNSYKDMVPDYYTRKQTLTNAERYITPELKELEDVILGAEDKLTALEYDIFCQVRRKIADEVLRIQQTAKAVAAIDVLASMAFAADQNGYCRPKINEKGIIDIKNGRHPVVERMISNDMFIANDTYLDNKNQRISIITGPNMAGKSTYMRQSALIVLMAQLGSFVPADSADIGIVDRIFTRVGASDDLASGQSTFMVEMTEVANILRNATSSSLLILDEIGRGTSTIDGLSIAWAVVEHISNPKLLGAKTLFATHYHELTELEGKLSNVNNYCIAVKEKGDDIVFLRKIVPGGADRSYGIQVAKLAGVPEMVIARSKEICEELELADLSNITRNLEVGQSSKKKAKKPDDLEMAQISLFDTVKDDDIIEEVRELNLGNLTPIDALNKLYELQNKIKNRW